MERLRWGHLGGAMKAARFGRCVGVAAALAACCGACGPKFNPGGAGGSVPDASNANGATGGGNVAGGSTAVKYTGAAATIINLRCASAGCHGGTQPPRLDSYAAAKSGFAPPNQGLSQLNSGLMPLGKPISAADKATLQAWAAGEYQQ